tara:strand:- start:6556 stop:7407 length:852 start_codon:yes stop_codon:yes gene_type:complete
MKKLLVKWCVVAFLVTIVFTCQETDQVPVLEDEIPQAILDKIFNAGYSTQDVIRADWNGKSGYVVEYDLFFAEDEISGLELNPKVPQTEQYHTTNLVAGLPRVIKVGIDPSFSQSAKTALDDALAMYNAENVSLSFQLATVTVSGKGKKKTITTDADIFISAFSERPRRGFITLGRAAGFPTASGDPAEGFGLNTYWIDNYAPSVDELKGVMAHEIGHTIGFRHTDYQTRESCGSNTNEGSAGVGAIYIPGTPSGSDATSLMQSCGPSRTFNNNDKIALDYLY